MARGRSKETTDEQFIEILAEREKVALTTGDVANRLDIHRKTALRRLKGLEEDGLVSHQTLGKEAVWAWYLPSNDPFIRDGYESTSEGVINRIRSILD